MFGRDDDGIRIHFGHDHDDWDDWNHDKSWGEEGNRMWLGVWLGVGAVVVLLSAAVVACCCRRRRRMRGTVIAVREPPAPAVAVVPSPPQHNVYQLSPAPPPPTHPAIYPQQGAGVPPSYDQAMGTAPHYPHPQYPHPQYPPPKDPQDPYGTQPPYNPHL